MHYASADRRTLHIMHGAARCARDFLRVPPARRPRPPESLTTRSAWTTGGRPADRVKAARRACTFRAHVIHTCVHERLYNMYKNIVDGGGGITQCCFFAPSLLFLPDTVRLSLSIGRGSRNVFFRPGSRSAGSGTERRRNNVTATFDRGSCAVRNALTAVIKYTARRKFESKPTASLVPPVNAAYHRFKPGTVNLSLGGRSGYKGA